MENENIFYVYVYLDPRKPGNYNYGEYVFDHEPFYVGKGHGQRIYDHLNLSSQQKTKNTWKTKKIKKLQRLGYDLKSGYIIKIKSELPELESLKEEVNLIKAIGRKDLLLGPLVNATDGGNGQSKGYKPSKETIEKNRQITLNRSPETLEKIRLSRIGKKQKESTKQKISIKATGRKRPPELMEKLRQMSLGNTYRLGKIGYKMTDEQKLNLANAQKNSIPRLLSTLSKMNLSIKDVIEIRKWHTICNSYTVIANKYRIRRQTVSRIVRNKFPYNLIEGTEDV